MSIWKQQGQSPRLSGQQSQGQQRQREIKDNSLTLFPNDKRSERDADFRGDGLVGGIEMWAKLWVNRSREGSEYFKISLVSKEEARRSKLEGQGSRQPPSKPAVKFGAWRNSGGYATSPRGNSDGPPCDVGDAWEPEGNNWEREP